MFTGIIEATGSVASLQNIESEWRLVVSAGKLNLDDVSIGDSIAVNGCCLTVVELEQERFSADVSNETMSCTTLGNLQVGSAVNLEKAMLATSRFGGHIVSGHIDGVAVLSNSSADGKSIRMVFDAPVGLAKYIAAKGSICIDGTSLTVNEVRGVTFTINVIPHTQEETAISDYVIGQQVNLEVDLVARYIERLMHTSSAANTDASVINADFLKEHGFKSA